MNITNVEVFYYDPEYEKYQIAEDCYKRYYINITLSQVGFVGGVALFINEKEFEGSESKKFFMKYDTVNKATDKIIYIMSTFSNINMSVAITNKNKEIISNYYDFNITSNIDIYNEKIINDSSNFGSLDVGISGYSNLKLDYAPMQKDQTVYFGYDWQRFTNGNCVAQAFSTAMEFANYKYTGKIKGYSTSYIYGSSFYETVFGKTTNNTMGMYGITALQVCCLDAQDMYGRSIISVALPRHGVFDYRIIKSNAYEVKNCSFEFGDNHPLYIPSIRNTPATPIEPTQNNYTFTDRFGNAYSLMPAQYIFNIYKDNKYAMANMDKFQRGYERSSSNRMQMLTDIKNAVNDNKSCALLSFDSTNFLGTNDIIYTENTRSIAAFSANKKMPIRAAATGNPGQTDAGHMVAVIGYLTLNEKDYFICHNSWGHDKDSGKFYISYLHENIDFYYIMSGFMKARPFDFRWQTHIAKGVYSYRGDSYNPNVAILAEEWNAFCDSINEFRVYAGFSEITFTKVKHNDEIEISILNKARNAIYELNAFSKDNTINTFLPNILTSTKGFTAQYMNSLVLCLNSIYLQGDI